MTRPIDRLGLRALHAFDPETAHGLALRALRIGLAPAPGPVTGARLTTHIAGLTLPNPLGLAAGFDKNAQAVTPLSRAGFGFIEVGAATPHAQAGNPRPRLFRLTEDQGVINRFGFNNDGMDAIADRLADASHAVPVGLNLGANKDSTDRSADYARVLTRVAPFVDFVTVNVSSPNTEALRDLQGPAALKALLAGVMTARDDIRPNLPVFLKIAPDLDTAALDDIAGLAGEAGLSAIIATNTTLDRSDLHSPHGPEKGGLSGAPLFDKSTRILAQLRSRTDLPLIGVGGISSGAQAYAKIKAGANALQLYSALVFHGLGLVQDILADLDRQLAADGHDTLAQAVGMETSKWT